MHAFTDDCLRPDPDRRLDDSRLHLRPGMPRRQLRRAAVARLCDAADRLQQLRIAGVRAVEFRLRHALADRTADAYALWLKAGH